MAKRKLELNVEVLRRLNTSVSGGTMDMDTDAGDLDLIKKTSASMCDPSCKPTCGLFCF